MSQKSYDEKNGLYLIPTPIGNLEDITLRVINTLKEVDVLFAEDTRVAKNLLNHLDINKKVISSHEHNEVNNFDKIKKYLEEGLNVGLVSDRGTPIVSDPGYEISKYVISLGYKVISLPGPTALIPALTSSGIAPHPFMFIGFLKDKNNKIKKELEIYKKIKATLIFYESPHRLINTLEKMLEVFGNRQVCVAREISKKFEEYYRGNIETVLKMFDGEIKGEIVIVVEGNTQEESFDELTVLEHINLFIEDGLSSQEAIKKVAKERGVSKSLIYKEYHLNKGN